MGFFSKKKKSTTDESSSSSSSTRPSASASSSSSSSLQLRGSSQLPAITVTEPLRAVIRLRVAVNPAPAGLSGSDEFFWIEMDQEDEVDVIRRVISQRLGGVPVGLFKVNIPNEAFEQSGEYTRRYKERVDLLNHFSAFSLDDPTQIRQSLGSSGWQVQLPSTLRIKDWWPNPLTTGDMVSIIARPLPGASSSSSSLRPLTLLAHFAIATELAHFAPASPSLHSTPNRNRIPRRLPTPVDILPSSTIAELKAALLIADGRSVEKLDKIVLWRVEMSEEEMIVIEERGGLKSGQMPWPYPPTAEVPTAITNDLLPVSHYFPSSQSNTSLVSLSVWIHPSAQHTLARISPVEAFEAPSFRYPMIFPAPEIRRVSASHSLPATSPALEAEVIHFANTLPAVVSGRARRGRPSTAPANNDSARPCAFGSAIRGLRRDPSPLARVPKHEEQVKGLGIAGSTLPPFVSESRPVVDEMGVDMTRLNLKVDMGDSMAMLGGHPEDGKIVWQPAASGLKREDTQTRRIRSLAHNRSLRSYEIC